MGLNNIYSKLKKFFQKQIVIWHKIIILTIFSIIVIFITICVWREINIEKQLLKAIDYLFLFTIIVISLGKLWKIIEYFIKKDKKFPIKEGMLMLLYIFLASIVHVFIQPERMYTSKVNKPSIMISKTNGNEDIPKAISAIRARLVLGEDMNHSANQIESSLVYATIMVGGIKGEAYSETGVTP